MFTRKNTDFTIQNALFGAEIHQSRTIISILVMEFVLDEGSNVSFRNITNGKNEIIFDADFSSHKRNRQNEIFVMGKEFQGVTTVRPTALTGKTSKGTTIYAENLYKHNFAESNKNFVFSLHYNGDNSNYLLMEVKN